MSAMVVARCLLVAAVVGTAAADFAEPSTGLRFPEKGLERVGVRYKGPIKVYAVGEYADGTYMLKMSFGVGAQKMTEALADALKSRCDDADSIAEFEACLLKSLPNGAPKGTTLSFRTGGALGISVNGKASGTIGSKALSSAFRDIYCDANAVCIMKPIGADGAVAPSGGGDLLTRSILGAVGACGTLCWCCTRRRRRAV